MPPVNSLCRGFLPRLLAMAAAGAFLSCAGLSPVTLERTPPPRFQSIEEIVPLWQPLETGPGGADTEGTPPLLYFAGRVISPRLEFWVIQIDLTNPSLEFVASGAVEGPEGEGPGGQGAAPDPGPVYNASPGTAGISSPGVTGGALQAQGNAFAHSPGEGADEVQAGGAGPGMSKARPLGKALSTRVSSFVRDYGCIAGINTNPFAPVSAREGEERTVIGLLASGGQLLSPPAPGYDALALYRDGRAVIASQNTPGLLENILCAWGGFNIVLEEGALPSRLTTAARRPRHPRSAAGLSRDGKRLFLAAVDGRRPGSFGATEGELGALLRRLGAFQGLNFDGGGSTALVLRYPDGKVRPVNIPIHKGIPGKERAVAGCLGVRLRE